MEVFLRIMSLRVNVNVRQPNLLVQKYPSIHNLKKPTGFCCSYSKRQKKSSSSSTKSCDDSHLPCPRCVAKEEMRRERFEEMKMKKETKNKKKEKKIKIYTTTTNDNALNDEYSVEKV